MSEYTAKLNFWHVQQVSKKEFIIWGNVEGDKHERFEDGMKIHTSGIKNRSVKSGDIVKSRNNSYLLGDRLDIDSLLSV